MGTYYVKEDDTAPSLQATLKKPDGSPVDLTDTNVDIRITGARGASNTINADATIDDAAGGVVLYQLQPDDTNEGRYRVEFEVTYDDGSIETFPNKGYHTLMVGRNAEV